MTMTFSPGVNPSFDYEESHAWEHDRYEFIKPYIQRVPRTARAMRTASLVYVLNLQELEYILSFFHEAVGPAGEFLWTPINPIPSPAHRAPDLAEVAGGALGGRTYSVEYTWFDPTSGKETKPSPAESFAIQASKLLKVETPIFPTGVSAARIYAAEAGSPLLQASSTSRIWTEPDTGLVTGTTAAPVSNTLKIPTTWILSGDISPIKISSNRWRLQLQFQEVPL